MIWTIIFRTVLFYFLVVISYKIMGKREVGELGVFDFIISMLISQLIAICIENYKDPIWFVIVPTLILVLFQIVFSFLSLKSNKFRDILDGKESVIISDGKLNFSEMKKQKYNLNDLLLQLRDKGIRTIEEVDYANSLGLEVIVTDHHEVGEVLPNAIAVVDAKRKDSTYPFRELAGVGDGFKLIQSIAQRLQLEEKEYLQYCFS